LHDIEFFYSKYIIRKIHIIPNLTLLPEVHTASMAFPTASTSLLLEVPMTLAASNVPDPGVRLVFSVEAVAVSIQHLEEVPTASMALPVPIPMAVAT
jgi:hypothetical protein